jgi:hypothetical protein
MVQEAVGLEPISVENGYSQLPISADAKPKIARL